MNRNGIVHSWHGLPVLGGFFGPTLFFPPFSCTDITVSLSDKRFSQLVCDDDDDDDDDNDECKPGRFPVDVRVTLSR